MNKTSNSFIQYGKQTIEEIDIKAVTQVLEENKYLTTGPKVQEFEDRVCDLIKCKYAVAVNSGTAALHLAIKAINLLPGEEVIVPAISFAATANCVLYEGGRPVFCDVEPDTLNMNVNKIEKLITKKTKAIIFVDYAGQVPDYHSLRNFANLYNLILIEDAAHSFGLKVSCCKRKTKSQKDPPYVGVFADLTTFSFHPVKNMTTGEGGMVTTNNSEYNKIMKQFRTHGITTEYQDRKSHGYDITMLGYNYRITDMQCALGITQLTRVEGWIKRRQEIANKYQEAFLPYNKYFQPLNIKYSSAHHIYVIILNLKNLKVDRDTIFTKLKEQNIGVNVHYKPIYLLTLYKNLGYSQGLCPQSEEAYNKIITIPMYPSLTDEQINRVINVITKTIVQYAKSS